MSGFGLVLAFLLLGYALQRVKTLPAQAAGWLTRYVLNVAVPAMVLLHVPALTLDASLWVPLLTPWLLLLFSALLVSLVSRWRGWSRQITGALLIIIPLGNTSFLGFPVVESFYGSAGLAYAVLYDQLGSFIGLAFYATLVAAWYSDSAHGNTGITHVLWKILRFPPFIALVAAIVILLSESEYPLILESLISLLATTLVPVVMVAVGLQLQLRIPRADVAPFAFSLMIKLVVMPLTALACVLLLDLEGLAVQVSVLEAGMPPMITAGAVAMAAGLRPDMVAAIVGYGVLLSVVTLPLLYGLIEAVLG